MAEKKPVENHKEEVPFSHYVDLFRALDPQEAAARTGAAFDGAAFTLRLVDRDYRICWPDYRLEAEEGSFALKNLPAQTFLLRYLLEGKAVPALGTFKTFREMPWGELYIQPFTGRCLTRAAFTFGTATAPTTMAGSHARMPDGAEPGRRHGAELRRCREIRLRYAGER